MGLKRNYSNLSDDSARARLADDIDEGSFTMDDDDRGSRASTERSEKKPPKTCFARLKRLMRTIYKVISSVVGLLVLLVIYSFIGAAIFRAIEGPEEELHKSNVVASREEIIEVLQNFTNQLHQGFINETEWSNLTRHALLNYEYSMNDAFKHGMSNSTSDPQWTFWGSMFFCGTIYTTIGYGHIAPATPLGRVMTMVYAAIGIPLALVCLADLGKHFTLGLKLVWAFWRRYCNCCKRVRSKKNDDYNVTDAEIGSASNPVCKPGDKVWFGYKIDDEFNIPIIVAVGILVLYIFLGAFMYSLWEDWTYLECFYFVFISISTIGFGDILPEHPKFFLLSSVYVFIGLSLVSMCVNVAIEFFSKTIDKAKHNIDRAKVKAKQKAKEAKEKMNNVSKTIDRAKDRAKERVTDFAHVKMKSFKNGQRSVSGSPRQTPSSDDIRLDADSTSSGGPVVTKDLNNVTTPT